MNNRGEWGIGTNCEFSFVAATSEEKPRVYIATPYGDRVDIAVASNEWMDAYDTRIKVPIE